MFQDNGLEYKISGLSFLSLNTSDHIYKSYKHVSNCLEVMHHINHKHAYFLDLASRYHSSILVHCSCSNRKSRKRDSGQSVLARNV